MKPLGRVREWLRGRRELAQTRRRCARLERLVVKQDARLRGPQAAIGRLDSENSPYIAPVSDYEQHPDNDIIPDSPKQRRRCTLAYLCNPLVKGIVDSEVRQTVGTLALQATTAWEPTNTEIEGAWKAALDAGLLDELQLAVRHMLIDGGCVVSPVGRAVDPLGVEVIPYRRIKTPPTSKDARDGFRYRDGRPVSVYVEREESSYDAVYATGATDEVPLFAHPVLPRLAGQTKGLSWYGAAITKLEMVNRWMASLLHGAELSSKILGCIENAGPSALSSLQTTTRTVGDTTATVAAYAQKHRVIMLKGGKYNLFQAKAPELADFLIWNLRLIARALGVSFERLTYDLTKTSFSSTKFGDRDDRITVQEHQSLLRNSTLKPLYTRLLAGVMLRARSPLAGAAAYATDPEAFAAQAVFTLPGRPPVDELKNEQANQIALANRTTSRTRVCAERGSDPEQLEDEQMREDRRYVEKRKAMYLDFGLDDQTALEMALADMQAKGQTVKLNAADGGDREDVEDIDQDLVTGRFSRMIA